MENLENQMDENTEKLTTDKIAENVEDMGTINNSVASEEVESHSKEKKSKNKQFSTKSDKEKKSNKKKNPFVSFLKVLFGILIGFLAIVFIWVLYCVIAKTKIEKHVKEDFSFYASVPSVSKLLKETLELQALDQVFASPNLKDVYALIKTLRSNDFISGGLFSFLANVRADIAVYSNEQNISDVYIFADIGFRSSLSRLLPLVLKVKPYLFIDLGVDGLEKHKDARGQYFTYKLDEGNYVLIRIYKNLIIAKLSMTKADIPSDFTEVLNENDYKFRKLLVEDLKKSKAGTINILADLNFTKPTISASNKILESIMNEIDFTERSNINFELKNDSIKIGGDLKLHSDNEKIKNILSNRASVPKVLNRIPETIQYFTLLNFSSPDELLKNLEPFLTREIKKAYANADKLSKSLLRANLDELLLSWIGEEVGVFALDSVSSPVIFASIKDKQKCNVFFEKLFKSMLIDQSSTTVVDDIRVSRIVFPPAISFLLKVFGVDLPRPFYFIDGDFVFFSDNAEGIARYKALYSDNKVITKNEKIKKMLKNLSSESSFLLYYDLDRSVPFFLQNNKTLSDLLSHYGTGILSFKLMDEQKARFDLYAVQKTRQALKRVSNFPKQVSGQLYGKLHSAITKSGVPYLFWSTGEKIFSYNLTLDKLQEFRTDSNTLLTLELNNNKLTAVWALSKNGTVYKMDENLTSIISPVLTSYKSIGELVILNDIAIFSTQDKPNLVIVKEDGEVFLSDELTGKMTKSPVIYGRDTIVALPRSFDSQVHIFNSSGESFASAIELEGIATVKPLVFDNYIACFTEAGIFTLHEFSKNGETSQLYEKDLGTSIRVQPVYSKTSKAIFVLDIEGNLRMLNIDGSQKFSVKVPNIDDNMQITLYDITGDKIDDVFISGGGNAVYAYSSDLNQLDGFPISGMSNPVFVDTNADGIEDILTFGVDSKISAFEGFRK
ncbi:MAG: VCBS repeat-containing protein [Treponemataceae bacterium]